MAGKSQFTQAPDGPAGMRRLIPIRRYLSIQTENHGGKMNALAVNGGGARFIIRLPKSGTADT